MAHASILEEERVICFPTHLIQTLIPMNIEYSQLLELYLNEVTDRTAVSHIMTTCHSPGLQL